jgi:hypothetical protein
MLVGSWMVMDDGWGQWLALGIWVRNLAEQPHQQHTCKCTSQVCYVANLQDSNTSNTSDTFDQHACLS